MALTKATLIDLNANELILDLNADTSITADTDDTIHFKIGGSDEITITGTALSPSTSDGNALGTSALEWSDLFLADGAVINFGDDQDVSLTHVADTGLLLSSTDQLQFGDSGTYIHQSADGVLDLVSDTEIEINATTIDVNGNLDVSGTIVGAGALTAATSITVGSAVLTEAELETLDGITAGTAIASKVVTTDANIDTTGQRNLTISGELDAATGDFSGDVDIDGTANLDTVDIDGATQIDATVTVGVDDTGYDVKFFGATSGAHLLWDESVDDLILAGAARVVVPEGNLVLGSTAVTSTAAELNLLDGVSGLVQADLTKLAAVDSTATELNIVDGGTSVGTTAFADGDGIVTNDNGTMRQTSATTLKTYMADLTLTTAAQGNVTSLGTLTALTVDDVAIDGKVMTMTGSSSDTFVVTVGTNGATSLVTTDAAAAAANLQITADGTVDIDSAGVLTLDSGAAINIEPAAGSAILLDGTISIDAGVVTGATSITSTAFVGALTGAASSNLLKSGGTMTGDLILGDNIRLEIGSATDGDLAIYHDGNNSYLDERATGDLILKTSGAAIKLLGATENMVVATKDGAVDLYHNNAKKIETTATGVQVTGTALATTDTDTSNTGNVTLDFAANQNFVLTLTGNTTLVNPSTEQVGQSGFIAFIQDGTGSRTVSLGTDYETAASAGLTLTSTASATDLVPYLVVASGRILLGTPQLAFG